MKNFKRRCSNWLILKIQTPNFSFDEMETSSFKMIFFLEYVEMFFILNMRENLISIYIIKWSSFWRLFIYAKVKKKMEIQIFKSVINITIVLKKYKILCFNQIPSFSSLFFVVQTESHNYLKVRKRSLYFDY